MEDGNETKWEKKWLPDGQHYVYVHRITGEQTEPIVPECTCRCKAEQIEAKFTPFYHGNIGIKEEICSMDEEEELGKHTSCSESKELTEDKFTSFQSETIGIKEEICSMDEEEELGKDTSCCESKELKEAKFTSFQSETIGMKEEIGSMEEELGKDTTSSETKDLWNSSKESDLQEALTEGLNKSKNIMKSSHQSKSEKVKTSYMCKKCKKEMESLQLLKKHSCGDNDFDYICCTCEKVFKTKYEMIKHLESHGIRKTKCADNQVNQNNRERMKNDSTDETKSKRFKCICLTCEKIFTSVEYAVTEHMKIHSGEKPYVCDLCGSAFCSATYLAKHSKIHSGKKPYQCKICGKAFNTNSNYRHHLNSHLESRPYSCLQCDMAFKFKAHLNQHILYKHSPFSFTCGKCSKTFAREADLKRHSIVHGDRVESYQCEECGKTFKWPANFKMHRQTHDKHRPTFPCTVCDKVLMSNKSLKRHMVLHADD